VIDQLDAVSQVSGRYPLLWEAFDELCEEVAAYPQMRLVIVCRDFDLQHDPRLRKLNSSKSVEQIPIQLLPAHQVDAALATAGCDGNLLNPRQKELLRTPLHLLLLLDGMGDGPSGTGFQHLGELFDQYWHRKRKAVAMRLGYESSWNAVVDKLCETMSTDLTVYVLAIVVDDWSETVAAMQTEHVLVQDG